jgi:hypothetical protein
MHTSGSGKGGMSLKNISLRTVNGRRGMGVSYVVSTQVNLHYALNN